MSRKQAIVALILLVPAPSIGTLCAMVFFPDSPLGLLLFSLFKIWLLGLPFVWCNLIHRMPISFSPPRKGGFTTGLLSGLGISCAILALYFTIGDSLVNREILVSKLTAIGFQSPQRYICAAAYWILINSILEEYVWRWFCVKQCEQLLGSTSAVLSSALFFTLHHIVAMLVYLDGTAVVVSALGVFLGGALWSAMYIKYRSIWPGYLSHAIVDLCIFSLGAFLLF